MGLAPAESSPESVYQMPIKPNLQIIREKITRASLRVGRSPESVHLIAVTKAVGADRIVEAVHEGIKILGENRVQEALPKMEEIRQKGYSPEWHFIGKLQRNKVKYVVGRFALIHSVDSPALAEEISRQAEKMGIIQNILMEVNLSGETSKEGFPLQEALPEVDRINRLKYVTLMGLMTIPPFSRNPEESRPYFKALKRLGDQMGESLGRKPEIYSMGMSNDYVVAIEEGATHVRIGRAIFGERPQ